MSDVGFSIAVESDQDRHTVTVKGELDLAMGQRLAAMLEPLRGSNLLLDLSAVKFIDSWGIAVLLEAERRVREAGSQLSVRCSPAVLRVLSLTGLDKRVCIEEMSSTDGNCPRNPRAVARE